MKERIGNVWESGADIICVTTNCILDSNTLLVMGAGIAKQAALRYPKLKRLFAENLIVNGHHVCMCKMPDGKYIAGFPTKYNWRDKSDLNLILQSVKEITEAIGNSTTVAMTRPGCGLGRLNWELDVRPVIVNELDDRFTIFSQ